MSANNANFPQTNYPLVDERGNITQPWLQVLIALYNRTGGASGSISSILDTIDKNEGALLYRGESLWAGLDPGSAGAVLETNGPNAVPDWAFRVKQVNTGAGLTGGPVTLTGTISMAQMAAMTLKGNREASLGDPQDLSPEDVKSILNYIATGDAAGGDLGGTYPNPSVQKVNGTAPSTLGLTLLAEPSVSQAQSDLSLVPGTNVFKQRTVTGTTNQVAVANGDGTGGNPTLSLSVGPLIAGAWTPTLTNVANVSATTAFSCFYIRVGNQVFCWGLVNITPSTAGNATTSLQFSLPVASTFTGSGQLRGAANSNVAQRGGSFQAIVTTNVAQLDFAAELTSSVRFSILFNYEVL